jgi:hypothetical protein
VDALLDDNCRKSRNCQSRSPEDAEGQNQTVDLSPIAEVRV